MPSERPNMPSETYEKMLRRGASRGLGLQAGEVAWYPNRNDLDARTKRYAKRISVAAFAIAILAGYVGFYSSL